MKKTAAQIANDILEKLAAKWERRMQQAYGLTPSTEFVMPSSPGGEQAFGPMQRRNMVSGSPEATEAFQQARQQVAQNRAAQDPLRGGTKTYEAGVQQQMRKNPAMSRNQAVSQMGPQMGALPGGRPAGMMQGVGKWWKGLGRGGKAGILGGAALLGGYGLYRLGKGSQPQQQPQPGYY